MSDNYLNIYNNLINLTTNKKLYSNLDNRDIFSDRLSLFLLHFAFFLKNFKSVEQKHILQEIYDFNFRQIELSIREIGYGDQSINKKMKDLNKILYDILLKINIKGVEKFEINENLLTKYFNNINTSNNRDLVIFKEYFIKFYDFCFELSLDNMVRDAGKFNYGST